MISADSSCFTVLFKVLLPQTYPEYLNSVNSDEFLSILLDFDMSVLGISEIFSLVSFSL